MEKRKYPRYDVSIDACIEVEAFKECIRCSIENISRGGAYIKFDPINAEKMSLVLEGDSALLKFRTDFLDSMSIKGYILRFAKMSDGYYSAIYFLTPLDVEEF